MAIRQIADDALERAALVVAAPDDRLVIAVLPVVLREEHHVWISGRREDRRDPGAVVAGAGELRRLPPRLAAVLRHLDVAVVSADVNQTLEQRRFINRGDVAQRRR